MARKILLADDSVTAQNMGRKILADAGYEVIAVNNGSAALKKIAELKPDLVILDVYMPGYSGLEVCQRLKESQETARIPVLLTVGKLEPFKPEEAQRARAEGFIVKPFEASELLSALSKLEDKVVPRAEPSKPGRFARAIAAAEESSRGSRKETSEQNGWKSRIGFPHEKTEPEEIVTDDSTIYNPMNRDLRTVVETAGEKAAERAVEQEEKQHQADKGPEISVDVAALAPAGLPKDVTPEEVAAIAAAAAQIQMAGATSKHASPVSETQITEGIAEATGQEALEAAPDEAGQDLPQENRNESTTHDLPVTMAATAESVTAGTGVSRWAAVPVALEGEDATISLDQEMQKAYAASVTAEADPAEAAVEAPVAAIPDHQVEPDPVPEPEPVVSAETMPAEPAAAPSEVAVPSFESAIPSPVAADVAPVETNTGTSPAPEFTDPNQQPMAVAEFMSPVSEAEVAGLAGLVGLSAEAQLAPEAESVLEKATPASSKPFDRIVRATENVAEDAAEPAVEAKPDPEAVKNTAAAWASWRQIRDTSKGSEVVPAQAKEKEFEVPESAPPETARAVAAGAEQILQEASTTSPSDNPADVASIVDSVLADLRPKLMAEISRKMAEKK